MKPLFFIKKETINAFYSRFKKGNAFQDNVKSVSKKLTKSELLYRKLFETSINGILILEFDSGEILDANPYFIDLLGYPLNTIIGQKVWKTNFLGNNGLPERAFNELQEKGFLYIENLKLINQLGKSIEIECIGNTYEVDQIKVVQLNIRDISKRRESEKKQALNTKILWILNTDGDLHRVINDLLVEIRNYSNIDAVGIRLKENSNYPYYEVIGYPPSFVEKNRLLCFQTEQQDGSINEQAQMNTECICHTILSGKIDTSLPNYTKGGSFFTNNASSLQSPTLSKANQCLNQSYESVALIPLRSDEEIIGILQLNNNCLNSFSMDDIQFYEEIGNSIGIAFNRIKNETQINQQKKDLTNLNSEYLKRNEELNENLFFIKALNEELKLAKAKAEESNNLKSAFLANMSHEIRTPLNSIMGFSESLLRSGLSREKLEKYVHIIIASGQQLLTIISDIIDISKIEAGQVSIDSNTVNVNNLLNDIYIIYKNTINFENVRLTVVCERPRDTIQIKTDENRLKQILSNLINNAIKFTPKGEIEFGYKIEGKNIAFYVKDTGIGIAPENLGIIFQRFRQLEITNSGNGLGLSISKAYIEKMGGTISVTSQEGKGSTFTFTLPNIRPEEPITAAPLPKESRGNDFVDKTILVVEDNANNHTYIEELLSVTHSKILHAWNGKDAVDTVKEHAEISLVLMDIKMPIMDGYEATRRIKKIRPNLPVIAQTAYALGEDRKQAIDAGCDNYLAKPLDKNLLNKLLVSYLR